MRLNLYDHQKRIIKDDPVRTGLFLGTGSGKTLTALLLAEGHTLVICPKTQKDDANWEREAAKHKLIGKKILSLTVKSKEEFRRDADVMMVYDTVIVDEAHTCLGVTPNTRWRKKKEIPKTSQLFEALDIYIHRIKPKRFYLVTATIMRSPMTVWGAMKLLKHWEDVPDYYQFRHDFYVRLPMPGREVWVPKVDDDTKTKLAKIVRSLGYVGRLEDFFDVPDQTYRTIHLDLTPKQKMRIKDMKMEYPEPIVRVGKIHQIENGVLSGDEFTEREFFENQKLNKILDLALEFPRMVIFAKYRAQIDQIEAALRKEEYKVFVLTGDTKDRGKVIAEASKSVGIFIAQAQISAGWELPDYPVMVFASQTYSFVDYDQAIGRIQRANNIKKNLYINLVVKGGIDEAVDKALANKRDFNERIYVGA